MPNRAHWQLRYVRRTPQGAWVDAQYVLAQFPEWADPLTDGDPSNDDWDVLSDWLDVAVDGNDDLDVAWHGTVHTHIFGNDEAFTIRRHATGPGTWSSTWDPYISLWPVTGGFSFAPSICADAGTRVAMPVVFHDTSTTYAFDSNFKLIRDGVWDGNPPVPLTTMAADGYGLSSWFPSAEPTLFTHPNGRVWLTAAATDWPDESGSDMLIVLERLELTSRLRALPTLTVDPGELTWTGVAGATGYDVVRGDLETLRASGGDFTAATTACLADDDPATSVAYAGVPAPGGGFWFLVRGVDAFGGLTYDSLDPRQAGTRDGEIALAPGACP